MSEKKQKIIERIEKLECFLWNSMRWYWRIALKRDVEGKNPHMLLLRPFYAFDKWWRKYLPAHKRKLIEG